jgi:hypothetical protein
MKSGMPITPYLAGQAFEPELIREMSLALETVCDTLNLRLTDDANTRLVASKIVELASTRGAGRGKSKHHDLERVQALLIARCNPARLIAVQQLGSRIFAQARHTRFACPLWSRRRRPFLLAALFVMPSEILEPI